jgi:hypothetical protein
MTARKTGKRKVVKLCGVQGCCPTVTFNRRSIVIRDDNGGKVKLTSHEFDELQKLKK